MGPLLPAREWFDPVHMYARVGTCGHDVQFRTPPVLDLAPGFSGKPDHQRVVGDRQLSGPSAYVSPLQLLGDVSVPWRVKPAGTADAVIPSRSVQPRTWLCAQAGGPLVAEVPGRTEGSGAKTWWKREVYCYTPALAPGGTVATWISVPGAGFEADHATSD